MPPYRPCVSSKGHAQDLSRKGIYVHCIAPDPTAVEPFMRNQTEQTLNILKSANPNRGTGEPEEIAESIALPWKETNDWDLW
ncbi:hypothetical protein MPDQ_006435 [Monascus purpureus]|uniref:Uncharacterized protein n=1 Tax=Monascus purpureus TaxID=5098 RepID=A0A507QYS7_MONPU|nr:hypothetical protein MPDQ_006435 [Monascus purpureus]